MTDQAELHDTLLRLTGRIPDELLAQARLRLADGRTDGLAALQPGVDVPYTYAPALPGRGPFGDAVPPLLDLVGRGLGDAIDDAAQSAVAELPGSVALWRAWRLAPEWVETELPPTRLYVVEVDGPLPQATATVMRALAAAGLADPLVETYRPGDDPPPMTRRARDAGALLWTRAEASPIRIARVFDAVDGGRPRFHPDHERLDGTERARVVAYLEAGSPVLATTARTTDVVEPQRGAVVPMSYRTDGRWLWPESVTYYLREHGLAPQAELLASIRAAGPLLPAVDPADEHRALARIFQSQAVVPSRPRQAAGREARE